MIPWTKSRSAATFFRNCERRVMNSLALVLCRLCLAAYVGAATFFVAIAIRPIRSPLFDSEQKGRLTQMLFPGYYIFGFVLLGTALLAALWISFRADTAQRRRTTLVLLLIGFSLMLIDWWWIYSPLTRMIAAQLDEHTAPPAVFRSYHLASMAINAVHMAFCIAAALCACLPEQTHRNSGVPTPHG